MTKEKLKPSKSKMPDYLVIVSCYLCKYKKKNIEKCKLGYVFALAPNLKLCRRFKRDEKSKSEKAK